MEKGKLLNLYTLIKDEIYMREKTSFLFGNAIRIVGVAFGIFILFIYNGMSIHGEEIQSTESGVSFRGSLMEAAVDTAGKESPDESAVTIMEIQKGTPLLTTGEEEGDWYQVHYQGKSLYVLSSDLRAITAADTMELDKEMDKIAEEDSAYIESLEMQRLALKRSRIWRVVIIVLIAAVFVTGIVSVLRNTKSKNNEKTID